MNKVLKYLGAFCLLTIAASLAFCSMGVYTGMQTANRIFAGADNYTCRQFTYDIDHPETDKLAPMVIATIAYGTNPEGKTRQELEDEVIDKGMEPAVKKVYTLCQTKPAERVLNLFATTITSGTLVSSTATISGTALTSPTNPK